jgi:response regulator RpfG family c-di-GMP phosphodiesterase
MNCPVEEREVGELVRNALYQMNDQKIALADAQDTYEHSIRVADITERFYRMNAKEARYCRIYKNAALLHDIGKSVIIAGNPDVLSPKDCLNTEERSWVEMHPVFGFVILPNIVDFRGEEYDAARNAILCHHQLYGGGGYPYRNMAGTTIPEIARVICIIDSYDAMTTRRRNGRLLTKNEAKKKISDNSGTAFDPQIAKIFLKSIG